MIDYTPQIKELALKRVTDQGLLAPPFNPVVHRGNKEGLIDGPLLSGRNRAARTSRIRRRPIRRRASSTFRRTAAAARARSCPAASWIASVRPERRCRAWVATSAGCPAESVDGGDRDVSGGGEEGRRQSPAAGSAAGGDEARDGGGGGGGGGRGAGAPRRARRRQQSAGRLPDAVQGTGRPHHRDRPEHRRASLGEAVRRCAATAAGRDPQSSAAEGRDQRESEPRTQRAWAAWSSPRPCCWRPARPPMARPSCSPSTRRRASASAPSTTGGLSRYGMMTYMHQGKQYIVVQLSNGLQAFALP